MDESGASAIGADVTPRDIEVLLPAENVAVASFSSGLDHAPSTDIVTTRRREKQHARGLRHEVTTYTCQSPDSIPLR